MQLLIRIEKRDFLKKTEKFLEFILGVLLHPLGATFFFIQTILIQISILGVVSVLMRYLAKVFDENTKNGKIAILGSKI